MESKEVGRFYINTFENYLYTFIVRDNGRFYCEDFSNYPLRVIEIKPRFVLSGEDGKMFFSPAPLQTNIGLIKEIEIDDELFDYMKSKNMLYYSTEMAYLYDLKDKDGYDSYYKKNVFKRVHNKAKILSKQRVGNFN